MWQRFWVKVGVGDGDVFGAALSASARVEARGGAAHKELRPFHNTKKHGR